MWPPTLDDYIADQGLTAPVSAKHQENLDAAIAFVERVRDDLNFAEDVLIDKPFPTKDNVLGTIRLAARWVARAESPQGLIVMNDMGQVRVPAFDPDIERLLCIGRYKGPVLA